MRSVFTAQSTRRRVGAAGLAVTLFTGLFVAGFAAPASGAVTCKGRKVTKVGTSGHDVIDGTAGRDVIAGLAGNDTIYGFDGKDLLCGGRGKDHLFGYDGDDHLVGGRNDDGLYGDDGGNEVAGDDVMDGGPHSEFGGDWVYFVLRVTANLEGGTATGEGQDTLRQVENVGGSEDNDMLIGDDRPNYFIGGEGHDTIWGRDGNDVANGKDGNDSLFGGGGVWDWVVYLGATDPVHADLEQREAHVGATFDRLSGFELILGSRHDDELLGDPRINYLAGRGGDDYLDGRDGHDMALFYKPARANLGTGRATGRGLQGGPNHEGTDELISLEGLWGSDKRRRDILIGNRDDNLLRGYGSNDVLRGKGGNDYFLVESGTESIAGQGGSYDVVDYFFWKERVRIDLVSGSNIAGGRLAGVESVLGSRYADTLKGDSQPNYILGQGGSDTLIGRGGADALAGGSGARNQLFGGSATDRCTQAARKAGCEVVKAPPSHPLFVVGDAVARAERRYKRSERRYK